MQISGLKKIQAFVQNGYLWTFLNFFDGKSYVKWNRIQDGMCICLNVFDFSQLYETRQADVRRDCLKRWNVGLARVHCVSKQLNFKIRWRCQYFLAFVYCSSLMKSEKLLQNQIPKTSLNLSQRYWRIENQMYNASKISTETTWFFEFCSCTCNSLGVKL